MFCAETTRNEFGIVGGESTKLGDVCGMSCEMNASSRTHTHVVVMAHPDP